MGGPWVAGTMFVRVQTPRRPFMIPHEDGKRGYPLRGPRMPRTGFDESWAHGVDSCFRWITEKSVQISLNG